MASLDPMASLDTRSPLEIFKYALEIYGKPNTNAEIEQFKRTFHSLLRGELVLNLSGTHCISTDPMEDLDDPLLWRYCMLNTTATLIVIVSNGYHTSDERLEYIKEMFPCFQTVEFGVVFSTDKNTILFLRDGCTLPEGTQLNSYVNAGPCNSTTLASIFACLIKTPETRVITVGANDDCSLGAGINQKQTDEPGKLINMPGVWNNFIQNAVEAGVTCKNLSVNISRQILIDNPYDMLDTPFGEMATETFLDRLVENTGMFIASRPPPKFGLRVNEGNSIVDAQLMDLFDIDPEDPLFLEGLATLQRYMDLAKSQGLAPNTYVSAAIPIIVTCMFGGVYKLGVFGWAPGDEIAKKNVSCLTPESAKIFKSNLRRLRCFTPAYDVLAFFMLFS